MIPDTVAVSLSLCPYSTTDLRLVSVLAVIVLPARFFFERVCEDGMDAFTVPLQLSGLQADSSLISGCSEDFDDVPESLPGAVSVLQDIVPSGASTVSSWGLDPPCGAGLRNSSSSCDYTDSRQSPPSSEKSAPQWGVASHVIDECNVQDSFAPPYCPGNSSGNLHDKVHTLHGHKGFQQKNDEQTQLADSSRGDNFKKGIRISWLVAGSHKPSPVKKTSSKSSARKATQAPSSDDSQSDDASDDGDEEREALTQMLLDPRKTQQAILKGSGGVIVSVNPLVREALNLIISRYIKMLILLLTTTVSML